MFISVNGISAGYKSDIHVLIWYIFRSSAPSVSGSVICRLGDVRLPAMFHGFNRVGRVEPLGGVDGFDGFDGLDAFCSFIFLNHNSVVNGKCATTQQQLLVGFSPWQKGDGGRMLPEIVTEKVWFKHHKPKRNPKGRPKQDLSRGFTLVQKFDLWWDLE